MDELAYIRAADAAGFKYSWSSEHHFLTDYSHLSANESFMAFSAAQTKNIHLGSGIFNLTPPANHPARVAERVAMLDHLSEGRFEFGTGRGSSTTEQKGFGIDDQELTREMVAETLPQIVRMWKEEDYSYDGKFFSMPTRNVLPKPYTNPHPPAVGGGRAAPSTFELAARQGLGVLCFAFGKPEGFAPLIEKYKKEIENADPVGGYVNNNVMITTQMLCLEDGGRAREVFADIDSNVHLSLVFRYLDTFPRPPGVPVWPDVIPASTPEQIDKNIESGLDRGGEPRRGGALDPALRRHRRRPAELRHAVVVHAHRAVRGGRGHLRQARPAPVRQGPDAQHHPAAHRPGRRLSRPRSALGPLGRRDRRGRRGRTSRRGRRSWGGSSACRPSGSSLSGRHLRRVGGHRLAACARGSRRSARARGAHRAAAAAAGGRAGRIARWDRRASAPPSRPAPAGWRPRARRGLRAGRPHR